MLKNQSNIRNIRFKDFSYTKINLTQIWYDEFKIRFVCASIAFAKPNLSPKNI